MNRDLFATVPEADVLLDTPQKQTSLFSSTRTFPAAVDSQLHSPSHQKSSTCISRLKSSWETWKPQPSLAVSSDPAPIHQRGPPQPRHHPIPRTSSPPTSLDPLPQSLFPPAMVRRPVRKESSRIDDHINCNPDWKGNKRLVLW